MFFSFAFCTFFKIFHVRLGEKSKSVSFSRVYVCVKAKLTLVIFFYFFFMHLSLIYNIEQPLKKTKTSSYTSKKIFSRTRQRGHIFGWPPSQWVRSDILHAESLMSSILSRNHINTPKRIMIFNELITFPTDKSSIEVSSCPKRREAFSETRWKGKKTSQELRMLSRSLSVY